MRNWFIVGLLLVAGCAHHPRVQNPFPGVFRIAVLPFNDKTGGAEGLDTAQITRLFASELQQVPTFEVVPVQDVEQVLGGATVPSNQPELAFAVARAVHAQAVIVGDVTEYREYSPPRLGLHCEIYAMVTGEPEVVVQSPPLELNDAQVRPNRRERRAARKALEHGPAGDQKVRRAKTC